MENKFCEVCKNPGGQMCSNCASVFYCGKQHQKENWTKHKLICRPFKISVNDTLGRYLVATRDIKMGEVVIKEQPAILGPGACSSPICLGCYRLLSKQSVYACSRCGKAPMCNVACETQGGHDPEECSLFASVRDINREFLIQNQQIILTLRCLLKKKNDFIWNRILQLESHVDKRINSEIWNSHQKNVVEVLIKHGFVDKTVITEELIQRINGILDVNTFEARIPGLDQLITNSVSEVDCVRGLYLDASLMAHDCVGNTHIAIDDAFTMVIHASVPIQKGQSIYFNYINALHGTAERQEHLQIGKYFQCLCTRCLDPTELGTFMSSIKCPRCHKGYVCPPTGEINQRFKSASIWKCTECDRGFNGCLIDSTIQLAKTILEDMDKSNIKKMEQTLKRLLRTFPAEHSLILDLKQYLIGAYRNVLRTDPNPGRKVLTRKMELCKEFLPVLEKIEPGISRLRGITLYEMHIPLVVLSNRDYESHSISAQDLLVRLEEANVAARTAVKFLLYEPTASPEGRLAKRALEELKMLADSIESVKKIVEVEKNNNKTKITKKRRGKK